MKTEKYRCHRKIKCFITLKGRGTVRCVFGALDFIAIAGVILRIALTPKNTASSLVIKDIPIPVNLVSQ